MRPPNWPHIFGTDSLGYDVFEQCLNALLILGISLFIILLSIYFGGILLGIAISYTGKSLANSFFQSFLRYWISLPALLIAIFMLVLTSPGQANVIFLLSMFLIPSQSLYVLNQLDESAKHDFVTAKLSQGFSRIYIYRKHLYPYIKKSYFSYTMSRIPEIIMMDVALNFFGLGIQPPYASFGRMLYDGLGFMFSGWWLWFFPSVTLVCLNFFLYAIYSYGNKRSNIR